jgi:hypothetical protein
MGSHLITVIKSDNSSYRRSFDRIWLVVQRQR